MRPPKNPNKPQTHVKVAQQYITNPLLLQGRKSHLRLWLLVTSHQPLRAYLHGQGLVLFSSEPYDTKRPLEGPGVRPSISHVTNYARWVPFILCMVFMHSCSTAQFTLSGHKACLACESGVYLPAAASCIHFFLDKCVPC